MCDLMAKVGKNALQKVFTLLSKWGGSDLFVQFETLYLFVNAQ